ncbi:MAG TPA: tetratricopeptide repeat protein [Polyangia bacterium]|nr:tetratricopeptide repeat protein [Polyangia bacterium]
MRHTIDLRRKATDLQLAGRHREAARLCEQILEHSPGDAQTALKLGELRRKLQDFEGARAAFELAAELYHLDGLEGKAAAAGQVAASLTRLIERQSMPSWWQRMLLRRRPVG